jgi:hypothetical protein
MKHGTEQDKAQLPAPTNHNKPRQRTSRKRKISDDNRVRRRARQPLENNQPAPAPAGEHTSRKRKRAQQPLENDQPAPAPAGELPDLTNQLSEEAQEHGRQIE